MSEQEYRTEHDSMGEVRVPADALWRAQTQRAIENFPISGTPIEPALVHAMGHVKAAAAVANGELGVLDAREPFHVGAAVSTVLRELPRGVPVLAKLRPDPVRVAESVKVAADAGAEAVVLGGALPASLPDGRPAGLSGPAVSPLALRCVADARAALDAAGAECDVIACGGIGTAEDARTALRLGAVAVQVGSALFHDPTTAARLAAALDPDEGA